MGRAFEFRKARKMKRWSAMSKTFSRIGKDLSMAVKEGGSDPESNSRLRQVIQNAKEANMPKDNVARAIKKASGNDGSTYSELTYEGYAPNGIAIFIECTTDNINRTVADIRAIFNKNGGELGKNGSLEFMFEKKGVFIFEKGSEKIDLEELEMELIDFGLEELDCDEDAYSIICDFEQFGVMQEKVNSMSIEIKSAEIQRIPNDTKNLTLQESLKIMTLIEKFEENDDVQKVFHNLNITEAIISELNN